MHFKKLLLVSLSLFGLLLVIYQWARDIHREGTLIGDHSTEVQLSLRIGILLFIASEVIFFVAFFWAFFSASLSPEAAIGRTWSPGGITHLDAFGLPFFATLILLASGFRVTWAHHALLVRKPTESLVGLIATVLLGAYFTSLQLEEYKELSFCFSDSVIGSTFFIATGFHGFHVFIGRILLLISSVRLFQGSFSITRHFGLEAAIWYWHFVDVVWLFLFVSFYLWARA